MPFTVASSALNSGVPYAGHATSPFLTVAQLQHVLAQAAEGFRPSVRVLDASWHMPAAARNAGAEYMAGHLPGAVFWDMDGYSNTESPYPHMLPSPADFSRIMGSLGIAEDDTVVVYDTAGIFSAPRVWWMLKVMGHVGDVFILQGGRDAWVQAGLPISDDSVKLEEVQYRVNPQPGWLASAEDVLRAITTNGATHLLDARGPGRFSGQEAEPRAGVEAGHMPGAINVHYATLLEGAPAQFKSLPQLRDVFAKAGVDVSRPILTSCGSGVTACILAAALHALGVPQIAVYDGSWSEWGSRSDLPKVKA